MKKWLFVIGSFMMVISFQNCAQNPAGLQDTQSEPAAASFQKYSADSVSGATLWDNQNERLLDVDLKTGHINSYEEYGNRDGSQYCLRSGELSSLNDFLKSAEVCEPVLQNSKAEICTTLYKYPYAALLLDKDEVRLGESMSGCDIPTDLCDDKAVKFRSFAACVISHLDQRGCGDISAVEECKF